jgi:4-amino-4-deoxy-L-arabinose transferase-like glycosyltransferase
MRRSESECAATIAPAAASNHTRIRLAAIFLVAVALRLGAAQWAGGGLDRGPAGDEPDYVVRAMSLVEGHGIADEHGRPSSLRMPGVPIVLALIFSIAGRDILWARILMCVVGALLVFICYLLGRSLAGRRAGLICAVAAAVFPNWVWYSSDLLTDMWSAILTGLAVWSLIVGWRKNSLPWFALAGFVAGVGVLFRATGLALLPGIVLWTLLVMPGWRRRLGASMLVCAAAVAVIAPWAVRNTIVQGEFVPVSTQGGIELNIANNPRATGILTNDFDMYESELSRAHPRDSFASEARRSERYQADAMAFIRGNPGRFLRLCAIRLGELWKVYSPRVPLWQSLLTIASFGIALPFAAFQIARRGRRRGPTMLFVILIASHSAVHAVFTSVIRYRIPIEPLVLALAAAGLILLLESARSL